MSGGRQARFPYQRFGLQNKLEFILSPDMALEWVSGARFAGAGKEHVAASDAPVGPPKLGRNQAKKLQIIM